jgi:hypothetical protein
MGTAVVDGVDLSLDAKESDLEVTDDDELTAALGEIGRAPDGDPAAPNVVVGTTGRVFASVHGT